MRGLYVSLYEEVPSEVSCYNFTSFPQPYIGSPNNWSRLVNKRNHWVESSLTLPIRELTYTNFLEESTKSLDNDGSSLLNNDAALGYEPILQRSQSYFISTIRMIMTITVR